MIKARIFSEDDILHRVKWINNPRINQTMFFKLPATVEKTRKWYKHKNNAVRVDFSFEDEKGNLIGMSGFTSIDVVSLCAEFYIMICPELQGEGYGKLISTWMFNYAFVELNLNKIYLFTNDENEIAYRIYEKAGFKLEGILREHKYKNGVFLNRRIYGLLRIEWRTMNWKKEIIYYEF